MCICSELMYFSLSPVEGTTIFNWAQTGSLLLYPVFNHKLKGFFKCEVNKYTNVLKMILISSWRMEQNESPAHFDKINFVSSNQ